MPGQDPGGVLLDPGSRWCLTRSRMQDPGRIHAANPAATGHAGSCKHAVHGVGRDRGWWGQGGGTHLPPHPAAYMPTACLHTHSTPLLTHLRDAPANTPTGRPCQHTHSTPLPTHPQHAPAYTPTGRPCLHTYGTPLPTHPRDAPANTPTGRPCQHTHSTPLPSTPLPTHLRDDPAAAAHSFQALRI